MGIQNGELKLDPDKNSYLERSKYSLSPEKSIENLPQTSRSDSPPPISLQKIFESQAIRSILENLSKLSDENKDNNVEEGKESDKEKDNDEKENEGLKNIDERDEKSELENEKENSERKDIEENCNRDNINEEKDSQDDIRM